MRTPQTYVVEYGDLVFDCGEKTAGSPRLIVIMSGNDGGGRDRIAIEGLTRCLDEARTRLATRDAAQRAQAEAERDSPDTPRLTRREWERTRRQEDEDSDARRYWHGKGEAY